MAALGRVLARVAGAQDDGTWARLKVCPPRTARPLSTTSRATAPPCGATWPSAATARRSGRSGGERQGPVELRWPRRAVAARFGRPARLQDHLLASPGAPVRHPAHREAEGAIVRGRDRWIEGLQILVVDDEPANVLALRALLESWHFQRVETTTDPHDALARCRTQRAGPAHARPAHAGPRRLRRHAAAANRGRRSLLAARARPDRGITPDVRQPGALAPGARLPDQAVRRRGGPACACATCSRCAAPSSMRAVRGR